MPPYTSVGGISRFVRPPFDSSLPKEPPLKPQGDVEQEIWQRVFEYCLQTINDLTVLANVVEPPESSLSTQKRMAELDEAEVAALQRAVERVKSLRDEAVLRLKGKPQPHV